ncbi:MAG: glycosyl hydrolase [Saprospiraceae bacterium]
MRIFSLFLLLISFQTIGFAQSKNKKVTKDTSKEAQKPALLSSDTYQAFQFRNIGPAIASGRISDIAVNPRNKAQWYLAVASGGIWKTNNAGTSFQPIFENEGSYSVGCLALDPNQEQVIWAGSGENNNQRSVAYGDGVYRSADGGKSWKNMGLKQSEHIGMIAVHPTESNTVVVAAYGPLWSPGGDRGIYKTKDGGKTWKQVLFVSENTGFNEVHYHPTDPNIMYATAHQRRRHEWTFISGGPESAMYRSSDGGDAWEKLKGPASGELGRIGLALSCTQPDLVYAIVEGTDQNRGFYKSSDRGNNWEKQSGFSTTGNYYQEIFVDPKNPERIFAMDTYAKISNDGGKTFNNLGETDKHVDNHAIYIDPDNTNHLIVGCDGGLYETWDLAKTWDFKANLPITQFYRVSVDNAKPFYNVYGGTQDNNSLGGPSRTINASGIANSDWFFIVGGDGFKTVIDPTDPNIIYSQWQYGGLVRFDRKSGQKIGIQPQELPGEPAYRWNWDAPIIISAFDHKRIYFAANKVFKSDDRGDSWEVISPDLSRSIDRNSLPIMGKVWSMDAIAKNTSTSIYGNITTLSESPKNDMLLYAGTDDGWIQRTSDGGKTWKSINLSAIPNQSKIQQVLASKYDQNTVFVVAINQRSGDLKPYIFKSTDQGNTWTSISGDLPARGNSYCIVEEPDSSNFLFCGTEFGAFFSRNGGKNWTQLKGGLPTICVPEMVIPEGKKDLVIATFGRGFYILDDYSPLLRINKQIIDSSAYILPVSDNIIFAESYPIGGQKGSQGASYFQTPNPPIGVVINYTLSTEFKSLKDLRKEKEKELLAKNRAIPYPALNEIRAEDSEISDYILFQIADNQGRVIRRLRRPMKKGMQQVIWNGRLEEAGGLDNLSNYENENTKGGPLVAPGTYTVSMFKVDDDVPTAIGNSQSFKVSILPNQNSAVDFDKLFTFNQEVIDLQRVVDATADYNKNLGENLSHIRTSILQSSGDIKVLMSQYKEANAIQKANELAFEGDRKMAQRDMAVLSGLKDRLGNIANWLGGSTIQQTRAFEQNLLYIKADFSKIYLSVENLKTRVESMEKLLDQQKAPFTPGRLPVWKKEN